MLHTHLSLIPSLPPSCSAPLLIPYTVGYCTVDVHHTAAAYTCLSRPPSSSLLFFISLGCSFPYPLSYIPFYWRHRLSSFLLFSPPLYFPPFPSLNLWRHHLPSFLLSPALLSSLSIPFSRRRHLPSFPFSPVRTVGQLSPSMSSSLAVTLVHGYLIPWEWAVRICPEPFPQDRQQ